MIKGFLYATLGIDLRGNAQVAPLYLNPQNGSIDYNTGYGSKFAFDFALPETVQRQKDMSDMRLLYVKNDPIITNHNQQIA